jgi:hypothetical protein
MHKLLIYNHDPGRTGAIVFRECPTPQQRDARGPKVIRANDNIESAKSLVCRQLRLAFDSERKAAWSGRRQVGGNRDGLCARNVVQANQQVTNEERPLRGILVSRVIQDHTGGKQVVRPETQILMLNQENSAKQQPGSQ